METKNFLAKVNGGEKPLALSNDERLMKLLNENTSLLERGSFNLYRSYTINKGTSSERLICEPILELKTLQHKLNEFIKKIKCGKFSFAYEKGRRLKDNATYHKKSKHIFHTDIKNFFPSITKRMFVETFCKNMPLRYVNLFWEAVSFNDGLAVGAPTSPFIANRIMTECDVKLSKLYRFNNYKYSRYADDLVFSSKRRFNNYFYDKVADVIEEKGFRLNKKKSYFMKTRKEVTGILIVDKNRLSVGTKYKKRLKSEIYNYLTKGIGHPDILRGKFSYLKSIEPNYAKTLINKYKGLNIKGLLKPSLKRE